MLFPSGDEKNVSTNIPSIEKETQHESFDQSTVDQSDLSCKIDQNDWRICERKVDFHKKSFASVSFDSCISDRSFGRTPATLREGNQVDEVWGEDSRNFSPSCCLGDPSPFPTALRLDDTILAQILEFVGDPVAVCRVKMISKDFYSYVDRNEHKLMRDAVRLGGISMKARPKFWLWVTLEKGQGGLGYLPNEQSLHELAERGKKSKWNHVIERDVHRAFGNLPPHKSGLRSRKDSIVRALVTWGRSRIIQSGSKSVEEAMRSLNHATVDPQSHHMSAIDSEMEWGRNTPVARHSDSLSIGEEFKSQVNTALQRQQLLDYDLVLNGNIIADDIKELLQNKLSVVLNALAAAHPDVGYCQGMDYVVGHLLRIFSGMNPWKSTDYDPQARRNSSFSSKDEQVVTENLTYLKEEIALNSLSVEETCFRVMDSFFTLYNLQHFYWPELRCLKTSCLVFEKLIQIKLPVLADHFEHHELNIGLFVLGWFQTLFLYIPSMPSATVCHMWDIWLVERSFKIFFRVGTAILFLSQPVLLNNDLEGMMNYLNTFPDATLLNRDILMSCALHIKVTNRMLMELEKTATV